VQTFCQAAESDPSGSQLVHHSENVLRVASKPVELPDGEQVTFAEMVEAGIDGSRRVIGVIVSSSSYHLLPIQIETTLNSANMLLDEVKYLLPQALAVNVEHVQPLYPRYLEASARG
jgi:hypothetical protein